jgi:SP family general alpha glucoside:H+ symporter-like MFS transporter
MKIHTTELEKQMSAGASYIDMFKGIDRRRTEIVSGTKRGSDMILIV